MTEDDGYETIVPDMGAVKVEQVDDRLWCMHVSGADDVHPAPDRATAQLWAAQFTALQQRRNPIPHPYDPVTNFTVQEWPWSADAHAEGLPNSIAANTFPTALADSNSVDDYAALVDYSPEDNDPDGLVLKQAFARHRQAAYNQALKDAAEAVMRYAEPQPYCSREQIAAAILSLGDKSNG